MEFLDTNTEEVIEYRPARDVPFEVNGYCFTECIGHGAYSTVYHCTNPAHNFEFAAKVVEPYIVNYEEALKALQNEHEILSKLDHKNIISLYDFFESEGTYYLIIEYCSNNSLNKMIPQGGINSESKLRNLIYQLLCAVKACHEKGIAHRDIKINNILVDAHGRLKLADFGISKYVPPGTYLNEFRGTSAYMAPEVVEKKAYDPFKADVWALGILFVVLATGESPWPTNDPKEIIEFIKTGQNPAVGDVPDDLDYILKRMFIRNPRMRATIDEILTLPYFDDEIETIQNKTGLSRVKAMKNNMSLVMNMRRNSSNIFSKMPRVEPSQSQFNTKQRNVFSAASRSMILRRSGTRTSLLVNHD